MEGTGDTGEGRAEKPEGRKKHLDIRSSRKAEGTEGGESAIELRGRGHSLEAGTSVAISGTGEGGTFQHKLEPQKSSSPWSGNCLKQRKGD